MMFVFSVLEIRNHFSNPHTHKYNKTKTYISLSYVSAFASFLIGPVLVEGLLHCTLDSPLEFVWILNLQEGVDSNGNLYDEYREQNNRILKRNCLIWQSVYYLCRTHRCQHASTFPHCTTASKECCYENYWSNYDGKRRCYAKISWKHSGCFVYVNFVYNSDYDQRQSSQL